MDLQEFYKEHYFFEIDRRHQLTSALSIPVGVLTLLVSALFVISKDLALPLDSFQVIQLCFIAISVGLIITTIYLLVRSFYNYEYGYIATPKELKDYHDKLVEYYERRYVNQKRALEEIEELVNSQYAEYAHVNNFNNRRKSTYLHRANGFLIGSLLSVFITSIPYIVKSVCSPKPVQKIEIVNLTEVDNKTFIHYCSCNTRRRVNKIFASHTFCAKAVK